MKTSLELLVSFVGILGCDARDTSSTPRLETTGKVATQRINCDLPGGQKAVLFVRFDELETLNWKVAGIRVQFDRAKPIELSDSFIGGMWSPVPEIDAWKVGTRNGTTSVTISTGDRVQRKL